MPDDVLEEADGRLRRGGETRRAVLGRAVEVASIQGLDGLSIGQLANDLAISKSGLFAHFGAKEELQLATIRAARRIYADEVVAPALLVPPGLGRIWTLSESWLDYSRRRVFPGGCFFSRATHEFGGRPGPVRDALIAANGEWLALLERCIDEARQVDELSSGVDVEQLAFEINAFLESANLGSLLGQDDCYPRARAAVRLRLERDAAAAAVRPWG